MGGGASKPAGKYSTEDKKPAGKVVNVSPLEGLDSGADLGLGPMGGDLGLDAIGDDSGAAQSGSNSKGLTSGKLKKMALGQSTYKDQQRDYEPSAVVQFNKSQNQVLEWDASAKATPSLSSTSTIGNSGNSSSNNNIPPINSNSISNRVPAPKGVAPGPPAMSPTAGRGGGAGRGVGAPKGPPPRGGPPVGPPPGSRAVTVSSVLASSQHEFVVAPSEYQVATAPVTGIPKSYLEKEAKQSKDFADDEKPFTVKGQEIVKNELKLQQADDDEEEGDEMVYDWIANEQNTSFDVLDSSKTENTFDPLESSEEDMLYATFADTSVPLTPTRKHSNIPTLDVVAATGKSPPRHNINAIPMGTVQSLQGKFNAPIARPPNRPTTSNSIPTPVKTPELSQHKMLQTNFPTMNATPPSAGKPPNLMMTTYGGAPPTTPLRIGTPGPNPGMGPGPGSAQPPGSRTGTRPAAPPKPATTSPHAVKETKDVKRNLAHLPTDLKHQQPTKGDWLNKRYIVNNFILLDTLGSGSYAEVRLCKDRTSEKLYAMKIISKDMLKKRKNANTSETFMEDIKREIAIMKKLLHPNVLRLFEVLDDPNVNKLYLVLEYMKEGDLIHYLQKKGGSVKLSDIELWHIFRQTASGIRYLHYQNIIHGDIKPQNLLIGENSIVKIADFGISKMIQGSSQKLQDAGGTPAFMSPELVAGTGSFSGQLADIWALGATMWMLKFGNPPFVAKSIFSLYEKIQNDPLVFPYAIDPSLQDLLEKMLTKDPNQRATLQQVIMHPWMKKPPLNSESATIPGKPTSNISDFNNVDNNRFQPPPSYDKEENDAMNVPVTNVQNQDILMSLSNAVHKIEKRDGKEEVIVEENDDDDILATKWGADVFEMVDDEGFGGDESEDESVDQKPVAVKKQFLEDGNQRFDGTSRSVMSTEEEEYRAKKFQVQLTKRSTDNMSITSMGSYSDGSKAGSKESSTANINGGSAENISKFGGRPDFPSADSKTPLKNKLNGKIGIAGQPKTPSSGNRRNSGDDDDVDELTAEDFEKMMDTLSQQPTRPQEKMEEAATPIIRQVSMENVHVQWKNNLTGLGAASHSEVGRRSRQEDQCVLLVDMLNEDLFKNMENKILTESTKDHLRRISFAGIFDGHSGTRSSQYLSEEFASKLVMHDNFLAKLMEESISDTCRKLDEKLCQLLKSEEDVSGSTALIAIYDGRKKVLTVANVGDSLCVLSRAGRAINVNKMHRLTDQVERERVERSGASVLNNRVNGLLAVSRAFGDTQFKEFNSSHSASEPPSVSLYSSVISVPDVVSELITPMTEFAILACDGLWDVMSPQNVVNFVRKRLSDSATNKKKCDLQEITKELVAEAIGRGSVDNVSVIILTFHI